MKNPVMKAKNPPYLFLGIVLILLIIALMLRVSAPEHGDGICSSGENCYDHPADCNCMSREYCSSTEKMCVSPVCGNGACESFENSDVCCEDCPCGLEQEACDRETHKCELPDIGISDETAEELIRQYFRVLDKNIEKIDKMRRDVFEDDVVKSAEVTLSGEEKVHLVVINADGKITDVPIYQ